ncbi:MAG: CotH kinase family protein [Saprospiraceae bacterium]|nr:CotH kinase family protein [Saprospiraceae bacterium]
MKNIYILLFLWVISYLPFHAQVVINEYSASNLRSFEDNYSKYEDWIELYNATENVVELSGWYLSDKEANPKKWKLPNGIKIEGKGFLIIWVSGRDESKDGHYHTNFKFSQTNDEEFVVLSDNNGVLIEKTPLKITQLGHSMCKSLDGNGFYKICVEPTLMTTNNNVAKFDAYTPKPTIINESGFYASTINVNVENAPDYIIRYTTNGSLPISSSKVYTAEVKLIKTAVFKARLFSTNPDILPGFVDFKTFFINEPVSSLPIFSVASEDALKLAGGDRELNPISSLEVFDKDGVRQSVSYGELDSHGQDSWVNDQRSLDWISRDEMGYSSGIPLKLFSYSDRADFQRIIFRASGDDNYPAVDDAVHKGSTHIRDEYVHTLVQKSDMHMDVRAVERCLLFLNGKYWGVYTIREKPDDHDYIDYTYNQDKYDIQFLKTWGSSWAEYGEEKSILDWIAFRDEILNGDVAQPVLYDRIKSKLDIISLMDYMIANLSVVSSDWMNYNTAWWRGMKASGGHKKWGYVMWDNDATFDYYINYSGVPDISINAKACDLDAISDFMDEFFPADTTLINYPADSMFINGNWVYFEGDSFYIFPDLGKHEKIFLKLLNENDDFKNLYYSRYADMLNTAFSCENMISTLDSMVSIIRPEMSRHINRWGGTIKEWEENVAYLRSFVGERCGRIGNGLVECYNLTGPFDVTIVTRPPNSASIKLNTLTHFDIPWKGSYFGNMVNHLEATSNGAGKFIRWESTSGQSIFSNDLTTKTEVEIIGSDTLVAIFENAVGSTEAVMGDFFTLIPNPASDKIQISSPLEMSKEISYEIVDLMGKVFKSGVLSQYSAVTELSVTELITGAYILQCKNDQFKHTTKFMIIR